MTDPKNNLPPDFGIDYNKRSPSSTRHRSLARVHESVLVSPVRELPYADIVSRARDATDGGRWLAAKLKDLSQRRLEAAVARKHGESVRDHEAEGHSFAAISDLRALQRELDFKIQVPQYDKNGQERGMITTEAFALATSNLATTDLLVGMESVPTVVDRLVTDLDDKQVNTEIPGIVEFPHLNLPDKQRSKPLGETEEYREVGASEERYTLLGWKDGYKRTFSQDFIDLGGPVIFSQLVDLGQGAQEVLEFVGLRDIIDYDGSAGTPREPYTMIRERAGASLFSTTANTPSVRTPSGTRLNSNALVDITDLEKMRALLAGMRNWRNGPMPVPLRKLLVPDALRLRAWTLLRSTGVPGVFNEENFYGPNGPDEAIEALSTPFLDLYTTTSWFGGDPTRQFIRKWRMRPEVSVHGGSGTLPFTNSRIGMVVRIGWDCKIGVRDHTRWIENNAGTTAPADQ